jgi:2-C-methyl-D-erythritol 2,4-cyclodiphosphate synthase
VTVVACSVESVELESVRANGMEFRIGQGLDVHPFADGRRCILGGVEISGSRGLAGHSDADVLVHALMDAILGAIGEQDIGVFFPDTDPNFKDADSCELLKVVWSKATERGWLLNNTDITVLAQVPKISPYVLQMRERLGDILGVTIDRVTIKATTSERLGFIGREEGVVASAVVLLARR